MKHEIKPFQEYCQIVKVKVIKLNCATCFNQLFISSLKNLIGSGQFGEVFEGVWIRSEDNLEVAVKTLKKGSDEDSRLKFLQEAAIMGQFKHPNVVTMHGAITDGEPVSNRK